MASITSTTTSSGNRRWRARWRNTNGDSREKWFTTRRNAEAYLATVTVGKLTGEYVDPALSKTTVADYLVEWTAGRKHLARKTLATEASLIANHIEPVFGRRSLGSLTRSDLTKWISSLGSEGYSSATVHKVVTTFTACLESAADDGLIPRSPAHKLDLPSVRHNEKRFLNHEEVASLANVIDPRYRTLVITGAYTGLRLGELAGLRVSRLDLLRRKLRVEETVGEVRGEVVIGTPKTLKSRRTIVLPRLFVRSLRGTPGRVRHRGERPGVPGPSGWTIASLRIPQPDMEASRRGICGTTLYSS